MWKFYGVIDETRISACMCTAFVRPAAGISTKQTSLGYADGRNLHCLLHGAIYGSIIFTEMSPT